jgi:hypothetical protein
MGFSQMTHLIKLKRRNYINNQNDQCFLVKLDVLNVYYIPTSHPEGDTSKKKIENM